MDARQLALKSIINHGTPKLKDDVSVKCAICFTLFTKKFQYVVKCCRNRKSEYICRVCSNRITQSQPETREKTRKTKNSKQSYQRFDQQSRKSEFIRKSIAVHGNTYDYSKVCYNRIDEKVEIICPKHGIFHQTPDSHQRGSKCPKCARTSANLIQSSDKSLSLEEFINKANQIHDNKYEYNQIEYINAQSKISITCPIHGIFYQTPNKHIHGSKPNGCPKCPTIISKDHSLLLKMIPSNVITIENDREILDGLEIDIWIPQHNLGIEINGCYWHGCRNNNPLEHLRLSKSHLRKADAADRAGITLLQFWDHEVQEYTRINKIILAHLGLVETIYARKCKIVIPSAREAKNFFDLNHLQKHRPAQVYLGLEINGSLKTLISFSRHRKYDWEIIRYASNDCRVVGGFSKILSEFKKRFNPTSIMTFADRRISKGHVYRHNGFQHVATTKPNYFYKKNSLILSRMQCQKHKLPALLKDKFKPGLTERENMISNGYVQVYDAGNHKFLWS